MTGAKIGDRQNFDRLGRQAFKASGPGALEQHNSAADNSKMPNSGFAGFFHELLFNWYPSILFVLICEVRQFHGTAICFVFTDRWSTVCVILRGCRCRGPSRNA